MRVSQRAAQAFGVNMVKRRQNEAVQVSLQILEEYHLSALVVSKCPRSQ